MRKKLFFLYRIQHNYLSNNHKTQLQHNKDFHAYGKIYSSETGELKGQSHEKVGKMSVWGISLGPN
jgi:hypothetical protein